MQIIGIGTDIVECVRIAHMIERHKEMFLTRVFTDAEIRYCRGRRKATEHFAARFAAKEAVAKCLGSGMSKGLSWTEIEVKSPPGRRSEVVIHGATRELARSKRVSEFLLTIAHCRNYATATAIALADEAH